MLERDFQKSVLGDLRGMFPGCIILKNDAKYKQGIPDWIVLWQDRWAMLEMKRSISAPKQPNQQDYVDMLDDMSFAAFICPENRDEVLDALQYAFGVRREARLP